MLVLWQMRSCLLRGPKLDRMQVAAMPGGPEAVLSAPAGTVTDFTPGP